MPLVEVLKIIKVFMLENPSEFIYIHVTRDWTPIDDIRFGGWFRPSGIFGIPERDKVNKDKISREELIRNVLSGEIEAYLGDMLVKYGEKDEDSNKFLLRRSTTLGELVDRGK